MGSNVQSWLQKREEGKEERVGEVLGEEKIDYGKGRKNYQRHFDLLQQSLNPLFLSLEKMQHKQQHVAFKHHKQQYEAKSRGEVPTASGVWTTHPKTKQE